MPLFQKNEKVDVLGANGSRQPAMVVRPPAEKGRGLSGMVKVRVTRKGQYPTGEMFAHRDLVTARRTHKTVK